jgi:hypothetical protein
MMMHGDFRAWCRSELFHALASLLLVRAPYQHSLACRLFSRASASGSVASRLAQSVRGQRLSCVAVM